MVVIPWLAKTALNVATSSGLGSLNLPIVNKLALIGAPILGMPSLIKPVALVLLIISCWLSEELIVIPPLPTIVLAVKLVPVVLPIIT